MILKVCIKFSLGICLLLNVLACNNVQVNEEEQIKQHFTDSIAEIRIDSANRAIASECDTLMKYKVPELVTALLKKDSLFVERFSDSLCNYTDSVPRAEKVIRQLKVDCDSSLLKETYKRVQLLQKVKLPSPYKKRS